MKKLKRFFDGKISVSSTFLLMFITGLVVFLCALVGFSLAIRAEKDKIARQISELPTPPDYDTTEFTKLLEAAEIIKGRFIGEADTEAMTDGAINGMLSSLDDRWSYYVSLTELNEYNTDSNNNYVGIGITVNNTEEQGLYIRLVNPDGSAAQAGIIPGCYITAADGASLIGEELDYAVSLIRGEEGTNVVLTVTFPDGTARDVSVERHAIKIDPVSAEMIDDIGYVAIENFNADSASSFIEKTDALLQSGAKGLVFDVRFNGGGRVTELCDMLDYLLPECTIFIMETKSGERNVTKSDASSISVPCVVLVNDSSYSAAEYFAAILREYGFAQIVGEHTSGKGFAQSQIFLSDGSVLALSTQKYYLPSGTSLEKVGIIPDKELAVSDEEYFGLYNNELAFEDDSQLKAALEILKSNDE